MTSITDEQITNYIKTYFGFLIDAGFIIQPVKHTSPMDGWESLLDSENIRIRLISDKGVLFLSIKPKHENFWIGLDVMVYYLTSGKVLLDDFQGDFYKEREKQYQRLAEILQKYWNEIQEICKSKQPLSKDEFGKLRKTIADLDLKRYVK
jgi:hypothetical protein